MLMLQKLGNTLLLLPLVMVSIASGQEFDETWSVPTADRWNYGFNQTPGFRNEASVFGYTGDLFDFDERDGQMIAAFDTGDRIPTGVGVDRYVIDHIEVTVTITTNLPLAYDPTPDDCRDRRARPQRQEG